MSTDNKFNFTEIRNGYIILLNFQPKVKDLSDVKLRSCVDETVKIINNEFFRRIPSFSGIKVTENDYGKFLQYVYGRIYTFTTIVYLEEIEMIKNEVDDFVKCDSIENIEDFKKVLENVHYLLAMTNILFYNDRLKGTIDEIQKHLQNYREKEEKTDKKQEFSIIWKNLVELEKLIRENTSTVNNVLQNENLKIEKIDGKRHEDKTKEGKPQTAPRPSKSLPQTPRENGSKGVLPSHKPQEVNKTEDQGKPQPTPNLENGSEKTSQQIIGGVIDTTSSGDSQDGVNSVCQGNPQPNPTTEGQVNPQTISTTEKNEESITSIQSQKPLTKDETTIGSEQNEQITFQKPQEDRSSFSNKKEIDDLKLQITKLIEEKKVLEKRTKELCLADLKKKTEEWNAEKKILNDEMNQLKTENTKLTDKNAKLIEEDIASKKKIEGLEKENKKLKNDYEVSKEKVKELEKTIRTLSGEKEKKEKENERLVVAYDTLLEGANKKIEEVVDNYNRIQKSYTELAQKQCESVSTKINEKHKKEIQKPYEETQKRDAEKINNLQKEIGQIKLKNECLIKELEIERMKECEELIRKELKGYYIEYSIDEKTRKEIVCVGLDKHILKEQKQIKFDSPIVKLTGLKEKGKILRVEKKEIIISCEELGNAKEIKEDGSCLVENGNPFDRIIKFFEKKEEVKEKQNEEEVKEENKQKESNHNEQSSEEESSEKEVVKEENENEQNEESSEKEIVNGGILEENVQVQIPISYYLTSTPFVCEYNGCKLSIPITPDVKDGDKISFDIKINEDKIRLNCYVYCLSDGVFQRDGLDLIVTLGYSQEHSGMKTTYPVQIGNGEPMTLHFEIKEGIVYESNDQGLVSNDGRKGTLKVIIQLV